MPRLAPILLVLCACEPTGAKTTEPTPSAPVASAPPPSDSAPSPKAPKSIPKKKKKKKRAKPLGCVLPEPSPPAAPSVGGATTQVADWGGAGDRCSVPAGYSPWSWSLLRRVRGLREKVVIITVDGGLDVGVTHQGLDVLRDYGVQATYFLTTAGLEKTKGGRDLVQRIATEGHEVANHSVTHPKLTRLDDAGVRAEIADADSWLAGVLGYSPRPFFRPPFLARNERTDRITKDLCYRPVWFTVYTRDDEEGIVADDIAKAVLCDDDGDQPRKLKRGSILMFHASQEETVKAWPVIFTGLRESGFRFMTLSEAIQARVKRKTKKTSGSSTG